MRIRPNYDLIIGASLILLAILPIVYIADHLSALQALWNADWVTGTYSAVGFFGLVIFLYGVWSSQMYLEFNEEALRYHGYLRTREVPIRKITLALEHVQWGRWGGVPQLWFCQGGDGERLMEVRAYLDVFTAQDLRKFMQALIRRWPHIQLDPRLAHRLDL